MTTTMRRCFWVPTDNEVYTAYHDTEWGFPVSDDHRLFEKICLEGFQSGLSWWTILRKRDAFRSAFAGFDFEAVARFGPDDVERLVQDAGIVRHRGKIEATIANARAACELVDSEGSPSPRTCGASSHALEVGRRGWTRRRFARSPPPRNPSRSPGI